MSDIRLSYVVESDGWPALEMVTRGLAGQDAAGAIELVAVTRVPLGAHPARLDRLGRVTVVERGPGSLAAGRVAGIRAASSDVVALGETHVAPLPGWLEAVLEAHDAGADVVLPCMRNANPASRLSWAAFLMDYGRYGEGATPGAIAVPTYNATVRRSFLLGLSDTEHALTPGTALDEQVRARGARVETARGAVVEHLNVDRPPSWAHERVLGGLLLGATRGRRWPAARRAAYALAAPLIAVVLLGRALRAPRPGAPAGTSVALAAGAILWAAGEAAGYLGAARPRHARQMAEMEVHKRRFTRSRA